MLVTEQDIPEEFRVNGAYGSPQFVVDLPGVGAVLDKGKPTERVCSSDLCGPDFWSNDISGHGGLTKQGIGTLVLTGNNTYAGPTLVNQGGWQSTARSPRPSACRTAASSAAAARSVR